MSDDLHDRKMIATPSPDPTQMLVTEIARALVDHPEAVAVEALAREESTILRLHVSNSDIGKVIGKQGRTAHSLRTILSAVSMKYHHRYTLDIVETEGERAPAPATVNAPAAITATATIPPAVAPPHE
jgi:predicted RNA-binding protein YlqC (UPF0109 family)